LDYYQQHEDFYNVQADIDTLDVHLLHPPSLPSDSASGDDSYEDDEASSSDSSSGRDEDSSDGVLELLRPPAPTTFKLPGCRPAGLTSRLPRQPKHHRKEKTVGVPFVMS
jgi:hypothetical protein